MLGLAKMLKTPKTMPLAKRYVAENLPGLRHLLKSCIKRHLLPALGPQPPTYEDQVDFMAHHYDFFYHLDGFIDMASGDLEGHYDDVLLAALQIYYTSFPCACDARAEDLDREAAILLDCVRE